MANFWNLVNEVIRQSDVLLMVLDARLIEETRNKEIEKKIESMGKKLIYVLNKADLVDTNEILRKERNWQNAVAVSSRDHLGGHKLREKILSISHGKEVIVGVLGYPNTGKSSVINLLSGSSKAGTSSYSGYTKGIQKIRADKKVVLLDTPGVLPFGESDEVKHALIGSKNPQVMKDPEAVAQILIEALNGAVEDHFGVSPETSDIVLENIAKKLGRLKSGGVPNTDSAARTIVAEWQQGKIKMKEKV